MMWQATLRDLQWRRRRFMIAITGTALVFAMTLLLSGLSASFTLETDRTLKAIGGDVWVVKEGASGPFTAFSPVPETDAEQRCRASKGSPRRSRSSTSTKPSVTSRRTSTSSASSLARWVSPRCRRDAVCRDRARRSPTPPWEPTSARPCRWRDATDEVVGVTKHTTLNGGIATMFITLDDAQTLLGGNPIASAIVATGAADRPDRRPPGDDTRRSPHRSAPSAEERVAVDRLREDPPVDRGRLHHRLDRLPVGAWSAPATSPCSRRPVPRTAHSALASRCRP